jgi:peptide/nickel transport system permease protein
MGGGVAGAALGRLLQAVPVLFGVVLVNFLLMQAAPGDLADVLAGEQGAATPR